MKNRQAAIAILLLAAGSAGAQTVWRCGSSYSQKPCDQGVAVPADDARSTAQAREAAAAAKRDAKTADAMEKSRLALEAKAPSAGVIGQRPEQHEAKDKPAHKSKRSKKKASDPDYFTATTPAPAGEKKKTAKK